MDSNTDNEKLIENDPSQEQYPEGFSKESNTEIIDDESIDQPESNFRSEALTEPQTVTSVEMNQPKPHGSRSLFKKPVFYMALFLMIAIIAGVALLTGRSNDKVVTNTSTNTVVQERISTLGASIVFTEGTVEMSSDGENWSEVSGDESLAQSDYVRTAETSRAIILFDDGSVARLDNNTELWLSSLEPTGFEITLVSGQVYSRVIESEKLAFTVVTSNERYESLGTAYKTSTNGTDDNLEVYQSDVKVASQDVEVSEGNAYDTMTKQVAALDLAKLETDEFAQWNKQKDSESEEFKDKLGVLKDKEVPTTTPTPPTTPTAQASITLSATEVSDGVKLSWTLQGVSSQQGFKVVRSSTDSTPTLDENDAQYVGDPAARSRLWISEKAGSHYYRVCIYFEGSCSTYSNTVQANSPAKVVEPVVSGGVTLKITGKTLSWTLSGGNAPHGYKVLLSNTQNPTYPASSILYTGTTEATLPEKTPGTYYVRVCKFTNGSQAEGCVDYSNQVEYIVSGS